MIGPIVPPFRRGRVLYAAHLELLRQSARRNRVTVRGEGTSQDGPDGTWFSADPDRTIFARLVAHVGSGIYSWQQIALNIADGTWFDAGLSSDGTNAGARELNGATTISAGTRVELRPLPGGGYWFQRDVCG